MRMNKPETDLYMQIRYSLCGMPYWPMVARMTISSYQLVRFFGEQKATAKGTNSSECKQSTNVTYIRVNEKRRD